MDIDNLNIDIEEYDINNLSNIELNNLYYRTLNNERKDIKELENDKVKCLYCNKNYKHITIHLKTKKHKKNEEKDLLNVFKEQGIVDIIMDYKNDLDLFRELNVRMNIKKEMSIRRNISYMKDCVNMNIRKLKELTEYKEMFSKIICCSLKEELLNEINEDINRMFRYGYKKSIR